MTCLDKPLWIAPGIAWRTRMNRGHKQCALLLSRQSDWLLLAPACLWDCVQSEEEEGEEEGEDTGRRYARRVRQTVQRYSPPKDEPPPRGRSRKRQGRHGDDEDAESDEEARCEGQRCGGQDACMTSHCQQPANQGRRSVCQLMPPAGAFCLAACLQPALVFYKPQRLCRSPSTCTGFSHPLCCRRMGSKTLRTTSLPCGTLYDSAARSALFVNLLCLGSDAAAHAHVPSSMQACVPSLLVANAPDVACPYACCDLVPYKPGSPCPSLATALWQVEFFDPVQYDGEFTGSQQPVDSTGPGGSRKRRDREQSRDERARRRQERHGLGAGEESDGEEEVRDSGHRRVVHSC